MIQIKKYLPLGIFVALLVISAAPAKAWGPFTTVYINEEMKKDPVFQSSQKGQVAIRNWDYFSACAQFPDISTVHYILEGGKYEATHNYRLPDEILADATDEKMQACAYGMVFGHFIGDSVAHNQWIPGKIEANSIPNIPLHPLVEAAEEAIIIRDHPEIFEIGKRSLDIIADDDEFLSKMQSYITSSSGVVLDVKSETKFFQSVLGSPNGFYSQMWILPAAYAPVGYGYWQLGVALFLIIAGVAAFVISRERPAIILSILPFIYTFIMIAAGQMQLVDIITVAFFWATSLLLSWFLLKRKYSRAVPMIWLGFILVGAFLLTFGGLGAWVDTSGADRYIQESVDLQVTTATAQGWPQRYKYDPTGFARLAEADARIFLPAMLFGSAFIGIIIFLWWFFRWRNR